jgi:hypothetical protein
LLPRQEANKKPDAVRRSSRLPPVVMRARPSSSARIVEVHPVWAGVRRVPRIDPSRPDHGDDLLRPLVNQPGASRQVRLVYADTLNYLSHQRVDKEQGVADCEEARAILGKMGARDLTDLSAASIYADTSDSQARHAAVLGRIDEAEALGREVYEIADKVLVQRPGDLRSMHNRALAPHFLSSIATRRHDYAGAVEYAVKSEQASESFVRFNPSNLTAWGMWISSKERLADAQLIRPCRSGASHGAEWLNRPALP